MSNQRLELAQVILYLALNFSSIGSNHEPNPSRWRNTSLGLPEVSLPLSPATKEYQAIFSGGV